MRSLTICNEIYRRIENTHHHATQLKIAEIILETDSENCLEWFGLSKTSNDSVDAVPVLL